MQKFGEKMGLEGWEFGGELGVAEIFLISISFQLFRFLFQDNCFCIYMLFSCSVPFSGQLFLQNIPFQLFQLFFQTTISVLICCLVVLFLFSDNYFCTNMLFSCSGLFPRQLFLYNKVHPMSRTRQFYFGRIFANADGNSLVTI